MREEGERKVGVRGWAGGGKGAQAVRLEGQMRGRKGVGVVLRGVGSERHPTPND